MAHRVSQWHGSLFRDGRLVHESRAVDLELVMRELYRAAIRAHSPNGCLWDCSAISDEGDGFGAGGSHVDVLTFLAAFGGGRSQAPVRTMLPRG